MIRERPDLWLWSYKHWRYQPAETGDVEYPFYAHVNPRFERILAGKRAVARPGEDPPETLFSIVADGKSSM